MSGAYGLRIFDIRDHEGAFPAEELEPIFVGEHSVHYDSKYYQDNSFREEAWIFQYGLTGSGYLQQSQKPYRKIVPGTGFLIHVPERSSYGLYPGAHEWRFLFLKFRGRMADRLCADILKRSGAIVQSPIDSNAITILRKLLDAASLQELISPQQTAARLFAILCGLHESACYPEGQLAVLEEKRIRTAAAIFRSRYADPELSVQGVAEEVFLSRSYFSRLFSRLTGVTPKEFLLRMRFNRARELLSSTDCSVAEAAYLSGFSRPSHFSRLFHKQFGLSPTEFRSDARSGTKG